jgi:hypothetical protein
MDSGMSSSPEEEAQARLSAYAADYNRRMLAHCPPIDGKQ